MPAGVKGFQRGHSRFGGRKRQYIRRVEQVIKVVRTPFVPPPKPPTVTMVQGPRPYVDTAHSPPVESAAEELARQQRWINSEAGRREAALKSNTHGPDVSFDERMRRVKAAEAYNLRHPDKQVAVPGQRQLIPRGGRRPGDTGEATEARLLRAMTEQHDRECIAAQTRQRAAQRGDTGLSWSPLDVGGRFGSPWDPQNKR